MLPISSTHQVEPTMTEPAIEEAMLVNVSYNNKDITKKVDAAVGPPFTIKERFKMGGIGSPKLIITETSVAIGNLLLLDNNRNSCNVEMRPQGSLFVLDRYWKPMPWSFHITN